MLKLLPAYSSSDVIRTRESAILDKCHTIVDVGGEYDVSRHRFDHHQRSFDTTFPKHDTKLSSAGLVYLHFGKEIISTLIKRDLESEDVDILYEKMYSDFIEPFDANDNGISVYPPSSLKEVGITKRFEDHGFSIAAVVSRFNHSQKSQSEIEKSNGEIEAEEDSRFQKASAFVGEQFELELLHKFKVWLPARSIVQEAYSSRLTNHPSGAILVLSEGTSWSDHLYNIESENPENPKILYVLFPENKDASSKWRVRAVSAERGGFENRKDLPNSWKGLRDTELSNVSGIPGCIFVHASGFIGGNVSFEGALAMASKALEVWAITFSRTSSLP